VHHGIRSLDALHLASALALGGMPMRFATWDRGLAEAARGVGLQVVGAH
jgi:predicted nucleic acid-binding protein